MSRNAHCSPLLNFDWRIRLIVLSSSSYFQFRLSHLPFTFPDGRYEYGKNYEFLLRSFTIENEDGCLLINLPLTDIFVKNVTEA